MDTDEHLGVGVSEHRSIPRNTEHRLGTKNPSVNLSPHQNPQGGDIFIIMSLLQDSLLDNAPLLTQDSREIARMNERIKALLDLRRHEQDDSISTYLRKKNKEAKIKRTLGLRKNHLLNLDDNPPLSQHKKLSIDICRVYPLNTETKAKTERNKQHLNNLKEFEEDFASGKIDDKYEEMLSEYISGYDGSIHDKKAKDKFIAEATKSIKDKLFHFYVAEYKRTNDSQKSAQQEDLKSKSI